MLEITLAEGVASGVTVVKALQKVYDKHLATKDLLVKSSYRPPEERPDASHLPDIVHDLSVETVKRVLNNVEEDDTVLFVVARYTNLRPGFLYVLRTRGLNVAGEGPWSEVTYSAYTRPTRPHPPSPPFIETAALRSIKFAWEPPDDGGSAIIGYKIHLRNTGKYIELQRSSVSYLWEGLFPGRSYQMRVMARNVVGDSEWSDWNLDGTQSHTLTGAPETPTNPLAIDGTWSNITLETRIPFCNGAPATSMLVEQRTIEPFQLGEWVSCAKPIYRLPPAKTSEVEVVEGVDPDKQQLEVEALVAKLELLKASAGFNPHNKGNKKIDDEILSLVEKQKPPGSKIRFSVGDLTSNTLYEFRVQFVNIAGTSDYSQPSHRAKTNKAALPGDCSPPVVVRIGENFCVLEAILPTEGGARIKYLNVEVVDLDGDGVRIERLSRDNLDNDGTVTCRIPNLKPGACYIFRCQAESPVGCGVYSSFSPEIQLPAPALDGTGTVASNADLGTPPPAVSGRRASLLGGSVQGSSSMLVTGASSKSINITNVAAGVAAAVGAGSSNNTSRRSMNGASFMAATTNAAVEVSGGATSGSMLPVPATPAKARTVRIVVSPISPSQVQEGGEAPDVKVNLPPSNTHQNPNI